jgi:N-acetylmuramoyl-L-alanine amidase
MATLSSTTACSTASLNGLDAQILALLQKREPDALARIDDIDNLILSGSHVRPLLQRPLRAALKSAIKARGETLVINSALRTIAAQQLLRNHYSNGRCGIMAAAPAGKSNHNNATAIDIEDSEGWRPYLEDVGFKWLGSFDPMHYDYRGDGVIDLVASQVKAFQELWSATHPSDKLAIDGDLGKATLSRLNASPIEGWYTSGESLPLRVLRLTDPLQMGEDVKALQAAIRKAGIRINFDGVYGADTDRALREFQSRNGFDVDGILGEKTRKALGVS